MASIPQSTLDAKIERADKALKDAGVLIQKVASSTYRPPLSSSRLTYHLEATSKKQNKAQVRKILSAIQQTMSVLGGVAEYDSRAKAAVSVFMSVLQLEIDRRDNDEEIVAVCYSMTSMVYVLRYLNQDVASREDLAGQLEEEMASMSDAIKEFGAFADVYYTICKSWIVRFARSKEFKTKIREFADTFQQYQERIEFVLVAQMAGGQIRIANDLAAVKTSISTLIDRVGAPATNNEKQAMQYIAAHGQQILESTQGLTDIAKMLHDSVTSSTMQAMQDDLEELLEQNSTLFAFKLKGATMELTEAIDRSTAKILERMDSGPHDLIDEPDIKEIWKGNDWKYSVKCRTFVDALCNYYTDKFVKTEDSAKDRWTLKILSKVINYPAVGEAIDEDASGFISVHEINQFLKKNKDLTTPVWFAFWAVGPQYLDFDYTNKIDAITDNLEKRCRKLKSGDHNLDTCIDDYLDTLKLVTCLTDWSAFDEGASGLEELDDETKQDLVEVATALAQKKEALMQANLEAVKYRVAQASLPSITDQAAFRIEQSITVLLFLILRQHDQVITAGMQNMTAEQFASKWDDMEETLGVLVWEFHDRFKSLRRSWRSQKLDIELQVECYAGGLFNGWYQEVDQLSQRVTSLDARLDTIESMLKQILGMGIGGSSQQTSSGPATDRNTRGVGEENTDTADRSLSREYEGNSGYGPDDGQDGQDGGDPENEQDDMPQEPEDDDQPQELEDDGGDGDDY
ncbi:hypothetical protein DFH07DRAFT_1068499 [Mycena maculata]|uniref:EF-hand domain-containing protein n=1 Tax=Mycena maculata TaxID=230809 RepID=A0AAD7HA20_9AGAR|nr:hypothetical protein DFH07DRAFT_1068499 [Mycena maculata]